MKLEYYYSRDPGHHLPRFVLPAWVTPSVCLDGAGLFMKFTDEATGATFNIVPSTVDLWCIGPGDCGFVQHAFFDYPVLRSYCACQRIKHRPDLIFQNYRALDRVLMAQVREEQPEFVREARKQYLADETARLRAELADDAAFGKSRAWAPVDLALLRSCYRDGAKRLAALERELRSMSQPATGRARITEDQMEQARQFPITTLLDKKVGEKVICPGHDDKNASAHVYDWGVKCFVCGEHYNSVGWLMKVNGLTFIEAVRDLIS